MKIMKPAVLFVVGILAVLLAAGCSNPIASSPEETPAAGVATEPDGSFTVSFTLGEDGNARSVAGLDANQIRIAGPDGIRNVVQLIVVDQNESDPLKRIVGYADYRKSGTHDTTYTLTVPFLLRTKTYAFLLLMGHWEHDGGYNYDNYTDKPPTLLAAGLTKDVVLNSTGDTTVTISMYPLVVDTKFREADTTIIEPRMTGGKPEPAYLTPGTWDVIWTVQRSVTGANGFEKALIPAQKIIDPNADDTLLVNGHRSILDNPDSDPPYVMLYDNDPSNIITHGINPLKTLNGNSGWVNFNLEYVPFNLTQTGAWHECQSNYFKDLQEGEGQPVWIIRNGVNDLAQDGNTNFTNFGTNTIVNANGAIRYEVKPPPPDGTTPSLDVSDGKFVGGADPQAPVITFDTDGYTGTADVWYAVSTSGAAPVRDAYIWLDKVPVSNDRAETIAVADGLTEYYVHVVISKDGKVSEPEIIHVQSSGNTNMEDGFAVDDLDLSGSIMTPVPGSTQSSSFTKSSAQYTASNVTWTPTGYPFAAGIAYTATVTLTAVSTSDFVYNFDPNNSFTYSGASVSTTIPADRKTATVSITFPVTGTSALIDLSPVISVPTVGQTPFPASSIGGAIFQGPYPNHWYTCSSVSWSKSGNGTNWEPLYSGEKVELNNYYKVRITLERAGSYPYGDFSSLTTGDYFYCYGAFDIDVVMPNPNWVELDIFFPKMMP
jgi:hypothetical protein